MPQVLTGLPTATRTDNGGFSLQILVPGTSSGVPSAPITLAPGTSLAVSGTVAIATSGSTATATLPATVGDVGTVTIPGLTPYTPALDPTSPDPGEFVNTSGSVAIALRSGEAPVSGTNATYQGVRRSPDSSAPIKTTEVPNPDSLLFGQWNVEEISISRTFQSHPSGSLKFKARSQDITTIQNSLANGAKISVYGIGFEVSGTQFDEEKPLLNSSGLVDVAVGLKGVHEWYMKEPVKLGDVSPGRAGTARWISAGAIASNKGLSYAGADIQVYFPPENPDTATTTLDAALSDDRVRCVQGFKFLSDASSVQVRTFAETPVHILSDANIKSKITWNYPGREMRYQGIQLVEIYKNSPLNLDTRQAENANSNSASNLPTLRTICTPKENPSIAPEGIYNLRDSGLAFDNGGITKTRKCVTYIAETVIEEEVVKFGFVFRAIDVYYLATVPTTTSSGTVNVDQYIYDDSLDPASFWQIVETSKKTYHYNNYGYLTSISETGTRTTRLKSERGNETLDLGLTRSKIDTGTTEGAAQYNYMTDQINAYLFDYVQVTSKPVRYQLGSMAALFGDIQQKTDDPNWVPPYYCQVEECLENSLYTRPDPESTPEKPKPPVSTGKNFYQKISTTIVSTIPGREAFLKTQTTQNNEGTGLKNSLAITQTTENKGRPSVHTRGQVELISQANYPDPNAPQNVPNISGNKYILDVQGTSYPQTDPERNSFSAATVYPEVGRAAAECDLAIRNLESQTATFTMDYDRAYQEGDRVLWRGVYWVVMSISWVEKAASVGKMLSEGMSVKLGRLLRIPTSLRTYVSGR